MIRPLRSPSPGSIPAYSLYGEALGFPDVLHCETISARAPQHDWVIAPHRHNGLHQFYFLSRGEGRLTIDGETMALRPTSLVNIPPGAVHGVQFEALSQGFVLSIPATDVPQFNDGDIDAGLTKGFSIVGDTLCHNLLKAIYSEFLADNAGRSVMLRALALQFACHLARLAVPARKAGKTSSPLMTQFAEMVRDRYRDNWSVVDYAAALGVSRIHLNRLCRRDLGMTAQRHIELHRIREATRLLAYTVKNVSAIAYELGFEDPSYFARAFRRTTGHTPSRYRTSLSQHAAATG